ncbi:protein rep [Priestia megaterium]|uniref:protein rep n=1 Tax=Priestia megaterium TaxID=1404 RepID=UPI003AB02633
MVRLQDTTKNGKERDWKGKKKRSILVANHYEAGNLLKKAERMYECANVLRFKQQDETLKLYQAYFCKVRFCPMCSWRRSLKIAFNNKKVVEAVNERKKVQWLFLTLTVRNCNGNELKLTLDNMTKAWNRFAGYTKVKKSTLGYFRALEVTKNRKVDSEWNGSYHPHFHVLICVPSSYFKKKDLYLKQSDWTSLWKKAMKLDYDPIVHVQKVKPKDSLDLENIEDDVRRQIEEQKALLEISKYPVKDTDIIQGDEVTSENVATLKTFEEAFSYKRLISYGGLMKEIHKELNLQDVEDEESDLIKIEDENKDEIANSITEVVAYWNIGLRDYVIKK